jgi:hypothetical protein
MTNEIDKKNFFKKFTDLGLTKGRCLSFNFFVIKSLEHQKNLRTGSALST